MTHAPHTPELVQLWMLRLLTKGPDHRRELRDRGLFDEDVARALGLPDSLMPPNDTGNQQPLLEALTEQRERLAARQPRPPLQLRNNLQGMGALLALNDTEQQVLQLIVLYQLYPIFDDCYELARRKDTFDTTTRNIALMLELPRAAVIQALSESGRLLSSGLLTATAFGNNMLSIGDMELPSAELCRRLVYEAVQPVDALRHIVREGPSGTLTPGDFDHLQADLDILVPYLRNSLRQRRIGVNILLHGKPGTGKTELTRCVAETLGADLFELDYDPTQPEARRGQHRLQFYRAAQALLPQRKSLLLFDEADDVLGGGDLATVLSRSRHAATEKSVVNRLLETNRVPTLWVTNRIDHLDPAFARRFDVVLAMQTLPLSRRRQIVEQCCGDAVTPAHRQRLAQLEAATPAVLTRAMRVTRAGTRSKDAKRVGDRVEHLVLSTLKAQGHPVSAWIGGDHNQTFDPSCLNTSMPATELLAGLRRHPDARLCFHGEPGTGKTAFARWLAEQLDKPVQVKKASDLLSPWVGENEKNLAAAFDAARRDDALLLIDEVDSFLQARNGAAHHWEVSAVNELLTQMEQFHGLLIAATNRLGSLDPAALRRFDLKLGFYPANTDQAQRLLERRCQSLGLEPPDTACIERVSALPGLTPGDFAAVERRARFNPPASTHELIDRLAEECEIKAPPRSIGFV